MPENIHDPLWFYGQIKDIFSNKLDLSNDVTTTQSIEQLLPKHGVIIRKLCTGLQPLLWATIFDHPDHDVLHALKKYGQPPSTPHSPTSLSLDTLALRQIIIDPESLVRVTWFTLDTETKSAIGRFVSDTRPRATAVHSNYTHLAQYSPPTIPPDLLPLQELAATAIRSVGYNTTESGVYFDSVHSLYSRGHVMQDPHFDSDPTSVSKAALASNDKPTNSDYVNQVPWLLIVPGTPSGCFIMLWPHTPPGVTSQSVAIHIKFGEALAFRADVAHAGTFQQLLGPFADDRDQGRLHAKVIQHGGRPATPSKKKLLQRPRQQESRRHLQTQPFSSQAFPHTKTCKVQRRRSRL